MGLVAIGATMLPWRRSHLSYLITPRFSPACTGSVAVAALIVHDRCESWCLTEKQHSKLGQLHARCVRSMSHITLTQSRMYQIPTREIETELGWTQWTNRNTSPAVNCDGLDMSAACPFIVYSDVCSLLGYPTRDQPTRDQGEPRR